MANIFGWRRHRGAGCRDVGSMAFNKRIGNIWRIGINGGNISGWRASAARGALGCGGKQRRAATWRAGAAGARARHRHR
jgi:hypothetical protein